MSLLSQHAAQNSAQRNSESEALLSSSMAFAEAVAELHSSLDLATAGARAEAACQKLLRGAHAQVLLVDEALNVLLRAGMTHFEPIALSLSTAEGRVALTGVSEVEPGYICVALRSHRGQGRGKIIGVAVASGVDIQEVDLVWMERLSQPVSTAIENARLHDELRRGFFETAEALAEAIEKKDRCTGGHAKRVAHYAEKIGRELGLDSHELERLRLGALLHDVGKIGIEDRILKKDASLEGQEWSVMRTHPELGYQILKRISSMGDVVDGMRFHHERWDGRGYPLGLKGQEIPRIARIIAVADAFDAMVSSRPYRRGTSMANAAREIRHQSEKQFDPEVVSAFERAFLQDCQS